MVLFTRQQTFDTVVEHLRKQGCKSRESYRGTTRCKYRGPNGLKCAIGCLIPDEKYKPIMENCPVTPFAVAMYEKYKGEVSYAHKILFDALAGHDLILLSALQTIHDKNDVSEWEHELKKFTVRYGLEYKPKC